MDTTREAAIKGYQLEELIGEGAYGAVYRARQQAVERQVAVKIILPEFANRPEFIRRFETEAQLVAQLEHLHIVPLYDYWREPDGAYLVMRWLRGGSLSTALQRGPWKVEPAVRLVDQIAAALSAAHRQGVVHRDIKPANILLDEEDNAYLSDFGIAKAADAATATTVMPGTPAYMSPEQCRGEVLDRRSDIFAMGIVLYEMVTEQKPLMGSGSEMTILEMVRKCVVTAPRDVHPRVPEALDRVIMKALARNPDERYQDAGQMQRGIEKILRERPPVTARDLARFLELLFDRQEREEDGDADQGEEAEAGEGDEEPDPLSLDVLLKRFGID